LKHISVAALCDAAAATSWLMQPIEGLTWYLITQIYFQNMN
jgi:hypothetical protein